MVQWAKNILERLMRYERCARTLALSSSMGIYIAFSPFVGFHTVMVFLFSWLFALNFSVVLAVSMLINNPWTMVPLYGINHLVGDRILSGMGFDHYCWNPAWVSKGNAFLAHYVGRSGFSFWAFMIGGNFLGITLALCAYPIIKTAAAMMLRSKPTMPSTTNK